MNKCDCGLEKAGVGGNHSDWCSSLKPVGYGISVDDWKKVVQANVDPDLCYKREYKSEFPILTSNHIIDPNIIVSAKKTRKCR